jgi:dTMP kinase
VPDKFESQPQAFFENVAQGYAQRMAADPTRFARIDANQLAQSVWESVELAVRTRGFLP